MKEVARIHLNSAGPIRDVGDSEVAAWPGSAIAVFQVPRPLHSGVGIIRRDRRGRKRSARCVIQEISIGVDAAASW